MTSPPFRFLVTGLLGLLLLGPLHAGPAVQHFALPNGLRVVLLEAHQFPLVRVRVQLRLTPEDRPKSCPDLPECFLRALAHSDRAGRTSEAFNLALEERGIQLQGEATPLGLEWCLLARSRDQEAALELLGDLLLRPLLEASTWARAGGGTWTEAQAFQRRVFRPERTLLILHGDLGLEQAKRLVLLHLGTWPAQPEAAALTPRTGANQMALAAQAALSLRRLLLPMGAPEAGQVFTQADLAKAKRAWFGRQTLLSLDPEAQMGQVLAEALGLAPQAEAIQALTLDALNR